MKVIKFIPWLGDKSILEYKPVRASLPSWWKDGENEFELTGGGMANGMKTCIPFMEIMMTGYVLRIPFDIYVTKNEDGTINIRWNGPKEWQMFVGERQKELGATIPRPVGHEPMGFTWSSQWSWKTPRGYSTFVTHPFNRNELPFTTLSAIVDSDKFSAQGNVPFFLKKDFEGIIPAGTPFAQIYPFKREKWSSFVDDSFNDDIFINQVAEIREPNMSYKKRFWQKKEFL
jgi:hypothetical protein